jgi:hypothetical protein
MVTTKADVPTGTGPFAAVQQISTLGNRRRVIKDQLAVRLLLDRLADRRKTMFLALNGA